MKIRPQIWSVATAAVLLTVLFTTGCASQSAGTNPNAPSEQPASEKNNQNQSETSSQTESRRTIAELDAYDEIVSEAETNSVTGFRGISWGASPDKVKDVLGEPLYEGRLAKQFIIRENFQVHARYLDSYFVYKSKLLGDETYFLIGFQQKNGQEEFHWAKVSVLDPSLGPGEWGKQLSSTLDERYGSHTTIYTQGINNSRRVERWEDGSGTILLSTQQGITFSRSYLYFPEPTRGERVIIHMSREIREQLLN